MRSDGGAPAAGAGIVSGIPLDDAPKRPRRHAPALGCDGVRGSETVAVCHHPRAGRPHAPQGARSARVVTAIVEWVGAGRRRSGA